MRKNLEGFACIHRLVWPILAAIMILGMAAGPAATQKNKKAKSTNDADQPPAPVVPTPASDEIDRDIGEMLGAFQIGDAATMHKYYADNATFVSGTFDPPVIGWQNYAAAYERQRTAFQGMQLIRRNTFIFFHADVAWASYQWQFQSVLNGNAYSAEGQTTLVFNKVGDNWLIVHNHTSEICPVATGAPPSGQQGPAQTSPAAAPAPAPARP